MTIISETNEKRREIKETLAAYRKGDIPERKFPKKIVALSVDLCRAVAAERLDEDEEIIGEHHLIRNHLKFNQSILKEKDQEAISVFLTPRRLLHFSSVIDADWNFSCDSKDGTVVDEIKIRDIKEVRKRFETRLGEALTGAMILGAAYSLREALMFTGGVMMVLGALGIIHALIAPTRWMEIIAIDESREPIKIFASGKKSARKIFAFLNKTLSGRSLNDGDGRQYQYVAGTFGDDGATSQNGIPEKALEGIPYVSGNNRAS